MRRLVIDVQPPLLGTALATVLGDSFDIELCDRSAVETCVGDVAIVSGATRHGIEARTVVALPDLEGNAGIGLLWHGDDSTPTPIRISTLSDLLDAVAAVPALAGDA